MKTDLFSHHDYRAYCRAWIEAQPGGGRGMKTRMAELLRVQNAYVSRVLADQADFSPEQADSLNGFFRHGRDEATYFLLLVQYARAGSQSLKAFLRAEISTRQQSRLVLKERLKVGQGLNPSQQAHYYSAWVYAAAHVMVSLPSFTDRDTMARRLGLTTERFAAVLAFLTESQLIRATASGYEIGEKRIHLPHDSPLIQKHHGNWRLKALQSLDDPRADDLHYSSVVTLSKKDLLKLRAMVVEFITEAKAVIKDSKDETAASFCLDLFEV